MTHASLVSISCSAETIWTFRSMVRSVLGCSSSVAIHSRAIPGTTFDFPLISPLQS